MDYQKANRRCLKNVEIYSETGIITDGYIKIDAGKIAEIGSMSDFTSTEGYQEIGLPDHYTIIPGLIDVHIHGVDGADVMDGTHEALEKMIAAPFPKKEQQASSQQQ